MAETWFDTRTGELLVGTAAIEQRLPESSPGDVVPLHELLTAKEFPYHPGEFPVSSTASLTPEKMLEMGHWLVTLEHNVIRQYLRRLNAIGLGFNFRNQTDFRTMGEYRIALGLERGREYGLYDDWTLRDLVKEAYKVSRKVGGRPEGKDYIAHGLSIKFIEKNGGVRRVNELIGYPNFHEFDEDDCRLWGAKLVRVNGPEVLRVSVIRELSKNDRGPSYERIRAACGSWFDFVKASNQEAQRQSAFEKSRRENKLAEYRRLISCKKLPDYCEVMNEDDLLEFGGRYKVVKSLLLNELPDPERHAIRIALNKHESIAKQFSHLYSRYRAADIETEAVVLDVFDDIWPMNELDEVLKVA